MHTFINVENFIKDFICTKISSGVCSFDEWDEFYNIYRDVTGNIPLQYLEGLTITD